MRYVALVLILIVAGGAESIGRFAEVCKATTTFKRSGPFVLAGYGEVGRKVAQLLKGVGEEVQVIDRNPGDGVDVEGDILDHGILENSALADAQAVILAANVERIHRAGADFALSISQVAGQILAGRLLGQEAISLDPRLKVLKVSSSGLVGAHPAELRIRERTDASVVAVERGEELLLDFGDDFLFTEDDVVYICGSDDAARSFTETFPQES